MTYIDGKNEIKTDVQERFGDENYVKIYKIKLLAGRNIEQGDISKALLMLIRCVPVRSGLKPLQEAVGRSLNYGGNKMQIIRRNKRFLLPGITFTYNTTGHRNKY